MVKKSTISNLEHKLLLAVSSVIPLIVLGAVLFSFYNSLFPPPPPPPKDFFISNCYFPTPFEFYFLTTFLFAGVLANIFVIFRRVLFSLVILLIPFVFFMLFAFVRIYRFYTFRAEGFISSNNLISNFRDDHILFGGIIILLFLWHTKIVIQDKIREKQLNPKLA